VGPEQSSSLKIELLYYSKPSESNIHNGFLISNVYFALDY